MQHIFYFLAIKKKNVNLMINLTCKTKSPRFNNRKLG